MEKKSTVKRIPSRFLQFEHQFSALLVYPSVKIPSQALMEIIARSGVTGDIVDDESDQSLGIMTLIGTCHGSGKSFRDAGGFGSARRSGLSARQAG
jgi:hypothetical protein